MQFTTILTIYLISCPLADPWEQGTAKKPSQAAEALQRSLASGHRIKTTLRDIDANFTTLSMIFGLQF